MVASCTRCSGNGRARQRGRSVALLLILGSLEALQSTVNGLVPVLVQRKDSVESTCRLESFYMIDANSMAKRAKVPICDPNSMFRVSTETGRVFLRGSEEAAAHNATAMHFFGTYASSWFLFEGIADSPYQTRDQSRAGLFYVNDYCYYMWWLAAAQSKNTTMESPGNYLIKIYEEIMATSWWKQHDGANFVFFLPWSLSHVLEFERSRAVGSKLQLYLDIVCQKMEAALQITVENLQGRIMCQRSKAPAKSLVAPFVPNTVDLRGQALTESLGVLRQHTLGAGQRRTLVYFRGRCVHNSRTPSRMLRSRVATALEGEGRDIDVKCVDKEPGGVLPFERLLTGMEGSIFCLVLPETGQSSRMLSEAMLAGCIPVFIGPPFAAMPFHEDLNYNDFAILIYLNKQEWMTSDNLTRAGESEVDHAMSTAEGLTVNARLDDVKEIVSFLRNISEADRKVGLQKISKVRRAFWFYPELDSEDPSAVDLLVLNLCRRMNDLANTIPTRNFNVRRILKDMSLSLPPQLWPSQQSLPASLPQHDDAAMRGIL